MEKGNAGGPDTVRVTDSYMRIPLQISTCHLQHFEHVTTETLDVHVHGRAGEWTPTFLQIVQNSINIY